MPSDITHKSLAVLATLVLLLLLSFLILRRSTFATSVLEYFRSKPASATAAKTTTPLTLPELIKLVKPSVVEITTYDSSDDRLGLGSGFFTGPRQVVSNWHVVDDCYRAEVKTVDGDVYQVKGILASDKDADLVLLEVDIPAEKERVLKVAAKTPDEGERIVVIGNPLGLEGTVSDGIISSIREVPELGRLIQVTAPISHGSSGGPVVNMLGEVIGVARGTLSEGQNLNFAVPALEIATLKRRPLLSFVDLRHQEATEFYDRAIELANSGSCGPAIPLLKQAVITDRNYEQAWFQLGACHFNTAHYTEALTAFEMALTINPQSEAASYEAGRSSAELELWDKAAGFYQKAIQLNPRNDDAQFGLGLVMCNSDDIEGAQRIYRNLLRVRSKRTQELYEACPDVQGEETPQ